MKPLSIDYYSRISRRLGLRPRGAERYAFCQYHLLFSNELEQVVLRRQGLVRNDLIRDFYLLDFCFILKSNFQMIFMSSSILSCSIFKL